MSTAFGGFKHILVPLDGSVEAESAIPYALDLAEKYSAQVLLYRAAVVAPQWGGLGYPVAGSAVGVTPYLELQEYEQKAVEQYLLDAARRFAHARVALGVEQEIGDPAHLIIEKARLMGCGMIVMSSHGRDGLGRWIIGSIAEKVARHSPCPVLLIRRTEEA